MRRSILGVVVLLFVACGFVMAQSAVPAGTGAVTNGNCTIEWVQVSGKASVRITNNTDKAQTVQYNIGGKEATSVDVPAKTVVTIPYTGANANGKFAIAKVTAAAKPKALPAGATSAAVTAAPAAAAPAAATPAAAAPAAAAPAAAAPAAAAPAAAAPAATTPAATTPAATTPAKTPAPATKTPAPATKTPAPKK